MVRRLLELHCGTKSISKVFEKNGWECITLDIDPRWNPTICCDILTWDYKSAYPPGYFDMVHSSPPCTTFSSARWFNNGRFGNTTESLTNDMINLGIPPLQKTLEIIKYFKPACYTIENPQSGRMKNFLDLPYTDCSYCQYGSSYRKNTRLWNNIDLQLKKCKCTNRHQSSFVSFKNNKSAGSKFQAYVIPEQLCESIYNQVIHKIKK